MQIVPGKPYTSAGAERAPWRARTRAASASSSPVVTPGRTRRATSRSVAETARPARRRPSRSSGVSTDMGATLTPVDSATAARRSSPFERRSRRRLERGSMAAARQIGLNARRRGGVVATALAALALAVVAPRAAGVPMPGPPGAGGAASLGADISGLAFDPAGRLYVADLHGNRVVVLGPGDEVLATIGAGRLDAPTGAAVAPGGDVLVADAHGVTRFGPGGAPVAGWAAEEAAGLAVGADGAVYVSEADRVALFTGAGAPLGAFPAAHPRGIAI